MKIFGSYEPIRPDRAASPVAPPTPQGQAAPTPVAPIARTDSVQLSESGKSLARQLAPEARDTLAPERIAELRRKVFEGAYNTLDAVDQVARRIVQRGDL